MNLEEIISIGGSLIVVIISLLAVSYKSKKDAEYKNDERWLAIKDKASKNLNYYYVFLMFLVLVATIVGRILGGMETLYVNFHIMITVVFVMLGSVGLMEYFLLRKYDKNM